MNFSKSWKSYFQRFTSLLLCLGLMASVALSNSAAALAASNTTAGQGEVVMPEWYPDDHRDIDTMIEEAGVKREGSNDVSADKIGLDRNTNANNSDNPNLLDRAQQRIKEVAGDVQTKLESNPVENARAAVEGIRDREGHLIESAKGSVGKKAERLLEDGTPVYTRR
ncbi:hypothetical protein IFO70_09500 [Phormidium tenue FACHB-886]|nr:hypothetical protein [Phormidium tenue FACHB-886]